MIGERLGNWVISKELGRGGMGRVYLGLEEMSQRKAAIKVLSPELSTDAGFLTRFQREIETLAKLTHPNIVRFYEAGFENHLYFYAMEYVEGDSLDQIVAAKGRLPWNEVLDIAIQICPALRHVHDHGIIHRDIKPPNILRTPDGTIKLMDFGIAKDVDVTALTGANSTVGTAAYMSPEQCRGVRELTPKSDLYSMGIMFYELLTGKKPFVADSPMEVFKLHTEGTFERPSRISLDVPIWLDTLVCQLMEKAPDKRPFDALTVREALGRIKEKVDAQQSAGVEAAKTRRVDRSALQPAMDETDKEAARTLLHKKKKRKSAPFYTQGWFKTITFGTILVVVAYVLYMVLLKTPSADSLYAQAQTLMASGDAEKRQEARRGPIADFLRYYKDHEKIAQVRSWADEVDRDLLERQLFNRRSAKMQAADDAEKLARDALDEEDRGKLADAEKTWRSLQAKKSSKDAEERTWGLVADKFLGELAAVKELHPKLHQLLREEAKSRKPVEPGSEFEKLALLAARAEREEHMTEALDHWRNLKKRAEDAGQRRWFLLATKREAEIVAQTK